MAWYLNLEGIALLDFIHYWCHKTGCKILDYWLLVQLYSDKKASGLFNLAA
ncbi:hypothetical protein ACSJMR_01935 [Acinetobacter pecorum]|uniref:hypothetical protein n=1 Tax=Acinetobacter pecorum TaxID=2762215 RepID=UPI003EE6041C